MTDCFCYHPVRNMYVKFTVDCLSRFCSGAREMFNTRKPFPSKMSLTMKTATSNSL